MKMVSELCLKEERRPFEGVRFKTRESKSRDFAFGTRGNELYFL